MNDGKAHGYFRLSRKQFSEADLLWGDGTPFDTRSAWIWLLQAAAFKDSTYHTAFGLDVLERGEFVASLRYLGERWKWGKNKVARFLKMLEKSGRIAGRRTGHHGTVYFIVNYGTYQPSTRERGTPNGTEGGTIAGQLRDKVEVKRSKDKETDMTYPADFELLWVAKPSRAGSNPKRSAYQAFTARLRDGVAYDVMLEGTKRFNAHMVATGKVGTEYVMQMVRFLGPDRHFDEPWDIPATNGSHPMQQPAMKLWAGMKRNNILRAYTPTAWQSGIEDLVKHREVSSAERFRALWEICDLAFLREARSERAAVTHIAEKMAILKHEAVA